MSRSARFPVGKAPLLPVFLTLSLVSNLGTWMHSFSEQWLVLQLAGAEAARWAGRLSLAFGLSMLVFLPFGGSLADRFEARKILRLTQGALMLSALAVGLLAGRPQGLTLHRLLGFAAFAGLAAALSMPAAWGVLRQVAPPEHPEGSYAWFTLQYDLSRMAGPAVAAALLPVFGVAGNFFLNALSFAGMLAFCWCLGPAPARAAGGERREGGYRDLFACARRDPALGATLGLAACFGWLAWNQLTLLPVYATRYLRFGAGGLASLMTTLGLGALGASLGTIRWGGRDGRWGIPGCFGLYGLLLGLWAALPRAALAYGTCLLIGPTQALLWLQLNARAQRLAPARLAGRTTALFLTLTMGLMPVGTWIAGELAQALGWQGPRWVLAGSGLVLLAVGLLQAPRGTAAAPAPPAPRDALPGGR